jgi:hypothetical protein
MCPIPGEGHRLRVKWRGARKSFIAPPSVGTNHKVRTARDTPYAAPLVLVLAAQLEENKILVKGDRDTSAKLLFTGTDHKIAGYLAHTPAAFTGFVACQWLAILNYARAWVFEKFLRYLHCWYPLPLTFPTNNFWLRLAALKLR